MTEQLLIFLPVIHAGYRDFLNRHSQVRSILLIGEEFGADFPTLRKEIRALSANTAACYIGSDYPMADVEIVTPSNIKTAVYGDVLIAPDEDLIRQIIDKYDLGAGREIRLERTFLRWDRSWSRPQPIVGFTPLDALSEQDQKMMEIARSEAAKSSDWWRQVGAVAQLRNGEVIVSHNLHFPSEYSPYIDGDPRNEYHRGERTDLSTALHAEASIVAKCARRGYSTEGASVYVTTFPCPACARLLAVAGISDCFFEAPYSVLAGDEVMRSMGVRLHHVQAEDPEAGPHSAVS